MKKPKGILMDLGSTIIKEGDFNRTGGTQRLLQIAHNPRGVTAKEIMEMVEELDAEIRPRRKVAMMEFPTQIFQRLLYERFGVEFHYTPFEVELEFWKSSFSIGLEPGVGNAIDEIERCFLPIGIVSNSAFSGKVLTWELYRQGLANRFKFIMSSCDYGLRKPHPFPFLTAAAKLGFKPDEIWFVGDSLWEDIFGALGVGMTAIWYNPNQLQVEGARPHMQFDHWSRFAELLRRFVR